MDLRKIVPTKGKETAKYKWNSEFWQVYENIYKINEI